MECRGLAQLHDQPYPRIFSIEVIKHKVEEYERKGWWWSGGGQVHVVHFSTLNFCARGLPNVVSGNAKQHSCTGTELTAVN
ncbi:unnamed protein product [Hydatigera taeniaeformis]|uniref:Ovule protein n=1 Tax=Hydatigena taeniaeformis TaxID=6205 RepID=A0A0R3XC61_HYDTA|nr:unnamed protein product [Hydatigera taeniaeformis]